MPVQPPLPESVVNALRVVSSALDDIADANRQLLERERRLQTLVADLMRIAQVSTPSSAQLTQVQMAMQREGVIFASVSGVLKTRHDTAKNSIANLR